MVSDGRPGFKQYSPLKLRSLDTLSEVWQMCNEHSFKQFWLGIEDTGRAFRLITALLRVNWPVPDSMLRAAVLLESASCCCYIRSITTCLLEF
jgi:hypothetical protein